MNIKFITFLLFLLFLSAILSVFVFHSELQAQRESLSVPSECSRIAESFSKEAHQISNSDFESLILVNDKLVDNLVSSYVELNKLELEIPEKQENISSLQASLSIRESQKYSLIVSLDGFYNSILSSITGGATMITRKQRG